MPEFIEINTVPQQVPLVWDNGMLQDTDWLLSWSLIDQIKKAGKASPFRSVLSQYAKAEHITSCTKFAPFNALCSDMGYSGKLEDINEVERLSIEAGFKIGSGWFRSMWVDVVRKWWNTKFPDNPVFSFTGTLFTPEYYEILKLGRTIVCSISVNSKYWGDVLKDWKLDSLEFWPWWWHATAFRASDGQTDQLVFMDSVGKKVLEQGSIYTMTEWQLKRKLDPLRTIRNDFHFFIPQKVIKMITKDVAENRRSAEAIKKMIDLWIMTVDKDGKFNPTQPLTREMMAQVLLNLDNKGVIKL